MIESKKHGRPVTVALFSGGRSTEREVSISGAKEVRQALVSSGYQVLDYDPATDLKRLLEEAKDIDCAFLVLHGEYGEDGRIQGFLDMLGIPYQGAGVLGSALAMDKHLAKTIYAASGIPTPAWKLIGKRDPAFDIEEVVQQLCLPVMTKPRGQGSSVGIGIAHTKEELQGLIEEGFRWDDWVLIEEFVKGREITVGVLEGIEEGIGLIPLPVVEIVPGEGHTFFDYEAKYEPGITEEICPAKIPRSVAKKAQELAIKAHIALNLRHYSRTDMIVRKDGTPFVIETNTIPGMTPTSLFPLAARAAGLDFPGLIRHLVELAMGCTPNVLDASSG